MTNLPDSGWLTAIHKVSWWVAAAIAVTAVVVLMLAYLGAPWFGQIPAMVAAGIGGAGILFGFLLVFQWIDLIHKRRSTKVARPVAKLSDQQRQFLMRIYRQGKRSFELPSGFGSPRWLEELKNWRYIEWHSPFVITASTPDYYSITEDGWLQLEKFNQKSN